MFKWIKSLFASESVSVEVEAPQPAPIVAPQHFHVDRANATKVKKSGVELPDFDAMTKLDIDIYARDKLKLKLDRRRTKENMIEEINNHINKEK
jgi:hypothetical protein